MRSSQKSSRLALVPLVSVLESNGLSDWPGEDKNLCHYDTLQRISSAHFGL